MDVQCDRCKTEYEFDDALVSGRGTTVKCTNCGYQFKVHKQGADSGDDRWVIRTTDHRDLVFHTLKDLQKAILAKQVGKHDTLARGSAPPRGLGAIAELSPFFDEQRKRATSIPPPLPPPQMRGKSSSAPGIDPRSTQLGVAPAPAQATSGGSDAQGTAAAQNQNRPPATPPPPPAATLHRGPTDTLRPPESAAVPPPRAVDAPRVEAKSAPPPPPGLPASEEATVPLRNGARVREDVLTSLKPPPARLRPEVSSPLPPPARRERLPSYDDVPDTQPPARARLRAEVDSIAPSGSGRRVGGWVIGLLLLASVGVAGVVVGQKYRPGGGGSGGTTAAAPLDPRAQEFLRTGERALDDGDLETAKESFDKASVIAEKDPRVLAGLARLATVRADVPWLKQRLSPQDAEDAKRSLAELSAKAKALAEQALAAAPDDTTAMRVRIDALRIAGDREQARGLVGKVIGNAAQPETAYVLAALDLAEPEPLFKTIVERLRIAAQAEGGSGRARAALVYALARSGDAPGAKSELERLALLARPHPLFASLKAFVEKAPGKGDGGPPALASGPAIDVNSLPRPGGGGGAGAGVSGVSGDAKSLVAQASAAMRKGDYGRASTLFSAALDKNPNDSEAAAGLGDVARAQHDAAGARASYQRAVQMNGHYLPALIGLADAEWDLGDKGSAQKRYKDMVDNFPDGALPAHVKSRAEGSAPAPVPAPVPSPAPAPTAAPAPAPTASGAAAP